jgi:hypothetical protein
VMQLNVITYAATESAGGVVNYLKIGHVMVLMR